MAHMINEDKRMMYVGETPWHGLGKKLDKPATAREAIEAAQLDYKLELQPIFMKDGKQIMGKQAVVRLENSDCLGVVGNRYKIIQNVDAFNFFDVVVGEGQAIYHTAGALGRGERIWVAAKLPSSIIVRKNDVVDKYLLLTNTHNGTSSLQMFFTPTRVVCNNTLNIALKDAKGISLSHKGDVMGKIEAAREALGIAIDYYAQFEKIAKQMAGFKMDDDLTDEYFDKLLSINDPEDMCTRTKNKKEQLVSLAHKGLGNTGKSLWDCYNAVTEYVDHHKTVHNQEKDNTLRLRDMWFGKGAELKEDAYNEALALIAK